MILSLLLVNAAATWFMTGLIWFVQIVHYPLFAYAERSNYIEFAKIHCNLTGNVVGIPMVVEAITTVLLAVVWTQTGPTRWLAWAGVAMVVGIWLSTLMCSIPSHNKLCTVGFSDAALHYLVATNWIRTWLWSIRAVLCLYLLYKLRG